MRSPIKLDHSAKRGRIVGSVGIEILYPGLASPETRDSGVGAFGRIDHAMLMPGALIPMHPHKDDEILTYMRRGALFHRDTAGHEEHVSPTRLMLMGAGHRFQHEERVPFESDSLEALQIFMRPRESDLSPRVQFHEFEEKKSRHQWRLVAGPEGAPLTVRADGWVHDTALEAGSTRTLPSVSGQDMSRLLYVFSGKVTIGDTVLRAGESLLFDGREEASVTAVEESDLVLFTTDEASPIYKGGMFSGNVVA